MRTQLAAAVAVAAVALLPARSAHAAGVDEIVARAIAAQGGADKLRAIRSLRLTGTMRFGGDGFSLDAQLGTLYQRNGRLRSEVTLQGLTAVDALDGTDGWHFQPFAGPPRRAARLRRRDEALSAEDADFDGPLVDWQKKGHHVEYLGTEDVDGTQAHKLRVTRKDGDIEYVYLDPDTSWRSASVQRAHVRGAERVTRDRPRRLRAGRRRVDAVLDRDRARRAGRERAHHHRARRGQRRRRRRRSSAFPRGRRRWRALIVAGPTQPTPSRRPPPPPAAGARRSIDTGVISGLGVRNIGSAAMSGPRRRGRRAQRGRQDASSTSAPRRGGVWKSLDGGTTFKPVFDKQPVQSIGAITIDPSQPEDGLGRHRRGVDAQLASRSATASTSRPTAARPGRTWGCPSPSASCASSCTRRTATSSTPACRASCGATAPTAASTRPTDGGKTWSLVLKGTNLSTGCSSA